MFVQSLGHVSVNFLEFVAVKASGLTRRYTANSLMIKESRHFILSYFLGCILRFFCNLLRTSRKCIRPDMFA